MKTIDLALTSSGDIYFEDTPINNKLKLSFNLMFADEDNSCGVYDTLSLSFYHSGANRSLKTRGKLNLSFDYFSQDNNFCSTVHVLDDDVTKNIIHYIIKTTISDLKHDPQFGSDMELFMHKNIRDKNVLSGIQTTIAKAISNILVYPHVEVSPSVRVNNNGYSQGVNISIYDAGELVTIYKL